MDYNERRKRVEELPIYKKGEEIYNVTRKICDLIPDDHEHLQHVKGQMLLDAMFLTVKIAGAEGGGLYDLRMEAAAIIRKAARDLMVSNHSLEMFGFEEVEYFDIVRDLIEEYRLLFIEWVAGSTSGITLLTAGDCSTRPVLARSTKIRMMTFRLILMSFSVEMRMKMSKFKSQKSNPEGMSMTQI
jgi:hypothetical protein